MARVFLARDLRHPRQVAVKVLNPDLAAAIGPERFLREIGVTASLTHPHILPLLDSGQADGLLYYVMPFVAGETLRARLEREGMLSLKEAIAITRQAGSALAYAHTNGIVHRDVKPENILLSNDQAVVADFGVAQAVSSLGSDRLTETGLAVGTVTYMSPEQAIAEPHLDGRSDQYSLGCVLYEMLVGQPPFTGRDSRGIVARHTLDPVPPIRTIRNTVPPELERAVLRALAKLPVDRYPTTSAFIEALDPEPSTSVVAPATPRPLKEVQTWTMPRWAIGALVALILLILVVMIRRGHTNDDKVIDQNLVAVLPFRIAGSVDTTLITPEGMVELLHTALSGSTSLHAVDPAQLLPAWHRATGGAAGNLTDGVALDLAARMGAGKLLLGQVFGAADSVTLSARLLQVPAGTEVARVDRIAGRGEDALRLLDQLCIQLLAREAGQFAPRLGDLFTGNLNAFREYMAGIEEYRRGRYESAAGHYRNAVALDSSFAMAALDLAMAASLSDRGDLADGAIEVAWAHRDRLGHDGRLLLNAMAGPQYPKEASTLEDLALWERTVDSIPGRVEASYAVGDMLYHYGAVVDRRSSRLLARNAFSKALAGDSAFAPALEHLIDIAASDGDTAEVRRLARRYFALDSLGDRADYLRWRISVVLSDTVLHRQLRERMSGFSDGLLERVLGTAQFDAIALDDALTAADALRARAQNPARLWETTLLTRELALNLGRPSMAGALSTNQGFALPVAELFTVITALYWDGDSASAAEGARRRLEVRTPAPADGDPMSAAYTDACTVGLWSAAVRKWDEVARSIRTLSTGRNPAGWSIGNYVVVCRSILEAEAAATFHRPDAGAKIATLDSLMVATYPAGGAYLSFAGNMAVARLWEAAGNPAAALAAVRRRTNIDGSWGAAGLSIRLSEEGRLAVLVGDTVGAISAYQKYLRLRSNPEPRRARQVAEVRNALAALGSDQPR
jgi:serine/threonine-protein kinase